jgi:hypothetical protein
MIIRKAELKDAALLSETRKLQLIDEGIAPDCDIDPELEIFFKKLDKKIKCFISSLVILFILILITYIGDKTFI